MNLSSILITREQLSRITIIAAGLLLVPLTAMLLTKEVVWQISDFIIAGSMILAAGYFYYVLTKNLNKKTNKQLIAVGIFIVFASFWVGFAIDFI